MFQLHLRGRWRFGLRRRPVHIQSVGRSNQQRRKPTIVAS